MKNIHLFDSLSAFTEAYTGAQYSEPWVSYTRENTNVNYNKVPTITLRIYGRYPAEGTEIEDHHTDLVLPLKKFNDEGVYLNAADITSQELWAPFRAEFEIYGTMAMGIGWSAVSKDGAEIGGGTFYIENDFYQDTIDDFTPEENLRRAGNLMNDFSGYDQEKQKFIVADSRILDGMITYKFDKWK